MSAPGTPESPLRVAIVGSGPAGFYAAGALLKQKELAVQVDMFDSLPTPWGLVRAGVAPDHPNIKAVSRVFEKTATHPEYRFYGNVEIGRDLFHDDLLRHYHAIVYACGAQTDRQIGIPGEDLPGSWAATEFVAWYNGHPDYRHLEFDLSHERAVVIGNGNVAMDCARMLALTNEELAATDVADYALEALKQSRVREIVICGRRGPAQAAFTNPELLEMGELTEADVIVDPAEVELDEASAESIAGEGDLTARKNVEILAEYSQRTPAGRPKRVEFRFLVSPTEIRGAGRVEQIELVHNELYVADGGAIRPGPTDRHETLECGLVLRSIGYRGVPLPDVPFDDRNAVIPNEKGRVLDGADGDVVPGEYSVGWIKRGPTGVIGTNKKDAQESMELLLEDAREGRTLEPDQSERSALEALLTERRPDHVTYAGWESIDRLERSLGEPQGRPRVKICSREELLEAALGDSQEPGGGEAEVASPTAP
jgi:ferredoxin/flavodoxin---NADP+ reductase